MRKSDMLNTKEREEQDPRTNEAAGTYLDEMGRPSKPLSAGSNFFSPSGAGEPFGAAGLLSWHSSPGSLGRFSGKIHGMLLA
jgi:hypothetical protein